MRALLLLLLVACAVAAPVVRQPTPPDVEPDAELLPSGPSPSPAISPLPPSPSPLISPPGPSPPPNASQSPFAPPSPTPIPPASAPPSPTAGVSPLPSPSPPVSPGASPSVTPADSPLPPPIPVDTDGDGAPDNGGPGQSPNPEDFEGGDSNRARLAGGLTGGLFALLLLVLCIFCVVLGVRKKKTEDGTGVYTSTDAGAPPSGEAVSSEAAAGAAALDKDEARDMGPPANGGTTEAAVGAAAVGAGVAGAAVAGAGGEEVVPRGPTPPRHDYVLGAGPAATRKDFDALITKFERDEIGDNSAVLGVERTGVVGEGLESDLSRAAETGAVGAAVAGSTALPHETEAGPSVDIKPEVLPDRDGPAGITFDSQERLMVGGDGSGAISDAAMSLNAASIAEESGDIPSLERDPIVRERDQTF